jgi:hypothetical protein
MKNKATSELIIEMKIFLQVFQKNFAQIKKVQPKINIIAK